jgi:uncharacterized protein (DUF1501 family)
MNSPSLGHRHRIGITRREWLQVGYSGLVGMGLPSLLAGQARSSPTRGRGKSVILIFLTGAPSHIDTFDPKPEAPAEVRGAFRPIATKAPGLEVCEHLPLLAARADRWAVVRSMTHGLPSHEHATHMVLTGINATPPGATHMASRHDWPCFASGLDFVRPRRDGVPNGVMLPTYLNNGYGFSGQNAGLLGARYDPWHITQDPNDSNFRLESLQLPAGLTAERLNDLRGLLREIDAQQAKAERVAGQGDFSGMQHKAFAMLTSGKVKQAFAMGREDPRVRDRYGRHLFGQSLLLARRLVQAGVPIVQANMGSMNNWDTHSDNCGQLKTRLLPPLDQAVSALFDDLDALGLMEETLVVMVGEFGRTPRMGRDNGGGITSASGRDHWAGVFFALFAGAGVRGGQFIGKSDKIAAYPATRGYYPSDLGATIYTALGVDPASIVSDTLGRPMELNRGEVIRPLFSGAGV